MSNAPNLLLIMTDQLRHDCVGYVGRQPVKTPHLDSLAAAGVSFEHAYSAIPTCCPARQAFLRTKHPESFGAYWNYDITFPIGALAPSEYTWSRELSRAGYRSSYLGKWHVNPDHTPLEYGYDAYSGLDLYDELRRSRTIGGESGCSWRGAVDDAELGETRTHFFAREAARAIREGAQSDRPWHVRLDFSEPHLPCKPTGRFAEMYDPAELAPWGNFGDALHGKPFIQRQQLKNWSVDGDRWEDWAPVVARYFGAVSQVDDAIGVVLDALKDSGQFEETIVVFTADHGDLCGAHGMVDKHYVMYDEVVRVPLIICWPDGIDTPRVVESFVSSTLDVGPTILDLLGLPLPNDTHGRSLKALLDGTATESAENEIVSTFNGAQFGLYCQRMLRTDRWKYVWNLTDVDELYDLESDPFELTNRAQDAEYTETLTSLRGRLYDRLTEVGDPLCTGPWVAGQLNDDNPLKTLTFR